MTIIYQYIAHVEISDHPSKTMCKTFVRKDKAIDFVINNSNKNRDSISTLSINEDGDVIQTIVESVLIDGTLRVEP